MSEYSETFLEYAKNPPNKGKMEGATVSHFEENRSCGDALEAFLKIADGKIADFSFEGKTSIVTTACAAMFGESVIGMEAETPLSMNYEDVRAIIGSDVSPRRKAASVLGLLATRNALHKWKGDGITDDFSDVL
jgi:NifU-like protein involved in Fe-S cluster formation